MPVGQLDDVCGLHELRNIISHLHYSLFSTAFQAFYENSGAICAHVPSDVDKLGVIELGQPSHCSYV